MTLIIDGVFLQLQRPESTQLWRPLLPLLASHLDIPIVLLDRGGQREQIAGIEVIPYPSYKPKFNTHDSALLERVCRHYGASAFVSTHFTTPLQTPSALLVHDMQPERAGIELATREQQEKEVAVAHARRFVCTSRDTRDDLLAFYPELNPRTIRQAHYPTKADPGQPIPPTQPAIAAFRAQYDLKRPYFVASATAHQPHMALLSDALTATDSDAFDLLCIDASGGEPTQTLLANGSRIVRVILDDASLAPAYAGAAALLHPWSDGLLQSAVEAMAYGCPIITTSSGRLAADVGRDAVLTIGDPSSASLVEAMRAVRDPANRNRLSAAGFQEAARLRCAPLADALRQAVHEISTEHRAGVHKTFYDTWTRLRTIQGDVDVVP
ncbi:glycosyltransferase [Variovorax arabinosiphilus]|uniref:glycosyltransferase n=1 Tax=Variovorax arabinosiphilus TaxID=3053498 RepID=UPI002574E66D|nr:MULTISPECIES: glycosyltransferase [unclassified Variovorax]MDM0122288.1 glycosyltransferase [Variovorax sp. J2L1-78]MDM0131183.1 glycosyltransferase [Variovorax sp. J2L1-63]MDM0235051.1 glycosyltransferase [Variovorax sp. J2R1-6]